MIFKVNNVFNSIIDTLKNNWVQICVSHEGRLLISFLKSLGRTLIQSKVGSHLMWINSFVIDMMEM
jgi:hypothetical protein